MQLRKITLGLLAIALCGMVACKKDKGAEPSITATGTWRPADTDTDVKYVIIGEDGYEHILRSSVLDFHIRSTYAYTATPDQIYLDGDYFGEGGYFNYKLSNDSLYIEAPGFNKVLLRDNNAPAPDTWVLPITFTPEYALPFIGNYGALEWDGTDFIILSGFIQKRMYKFSPVSLQTYDSINIVERTIGFCYHNGNIWVNNYENDNMLHTINFANGLYASNSVANASVPLLPASDGNKIWAFGSTDSKLYSYNNLTNTFTVEGILDQPLFSGLSGSSSFGIDMAIKDGYAYLALGGYIGKFNLSTRHFETTYQISNGNIVGIAYDGTNFWANGGNDLSNLSIGKLNLP